MTDIALHLRYLRQAMSLDSLKSMGSLLQGGTLLALKVSNAGKPVLTYEGAEITEVSFPPASRFYEQMTASGLPFLGNAVLQGLDCLAYQCLWPCEYARAGFPCQFCYSGGISEQLARRHKPEPPVPSARDAAEILDFSVNGEKFAKYVQITGGSTMNPQAECHVIGGILREMDSVAGLKNVKGEVLVFTTPPNDPKMLDQVFDAGADRIACSVEVWDEGLAQAITPGKWRFTGRKRTLDALKYMAKEYGPNKACSTFVVGVEPVESFLKGAEYLSSEGIVTIASLWIPFGRPVMGKSRPPALGYYRRVKEGLAGIYDKYGIKPPGGAGFNVDIDKDIWNHRSEILSQPKA
jgi:hypothetical protein